MSDLQELPVDENCLSYLKRVLTSGKTLSHMLMKRIDFADGRIRAVLSTRLDSHHIRNFAFGGLASPHQSRRILAQTAARYLDQSENRIVLEDGLARANDPAVKSKPGAVLLGEEVYYVAQGPLAPEDMERFFKQARYSIATLGVFCSSPIIDRRNDFPQTISTAQLTTVIASTDTIVFGAFDGEGYLLWTKS